MKMLQLFLLFAKVEKRIYVLCTFNITTIPIVFNANFVYTSNVETTFCSSLYSFISFTTDFDLKSVSAMCKCSVKVLQEGYSRPNGEQSFIADCSVSLVACSAGPVLVDTSGPWNSKNLTSLIKNVGLELSDIKVVVGTHGHSDHIGNLNLFPDAKFVVGFDVFQGNVFENFDFRKDSAEYRICDDVKIIPTPGHMHSDVSVVVKNTELGTVVVAGDLFENERDMQNPDDWKSLSENIELQEHNRQKVLEIADYIVPGHGKMFKVV